MDHDEIDPLTFLESFGSADHRAYVTRISGCIGPEYEDLACQGGGPNAAINRAVIDAAKACANNKRKPKAKGGKKPFRAQHKCPTCGRPHA